MPVSDVQFALELVERRAKDRDPLRDRRHLVGPHHRPALQLPRLFHRVEHDPDEDVDDDERGDEDEVTKKTHDHE